MGDGDQKTDFDLSESYDGIAARAWDWMGGDTETPDVAFYGRKIQEAGGTALDLTCGTGRHLLRYRAAGLDVEGVDSSAAMLERCLQKAEAQGLPVVLHQQTLQELSLQRQYRTIFISQGSFQLLQNRDDALTALRRCRAHLEPGGRLLFETFIPSEAWESRWDARLGETDIGERATWGPNLLPDGTTVTTQVWLDSIDRWEQVKTDKRLYQLSRDGEVVQTELHTLPLRWYFQHELTLMLESEGFGDITIDGDYTDALATARSEETVYAASAV